MNAEKKLRNQLCDCGSGKKFKNCHLTICEKAGRNVRKNKTDIDNILFGIVKTYKIKPIDKGNYPVKRRQVEGTQKYIYSVCGIDCIEVDYTGIPMQLATISDYERVAEIDVNAIPKTIIYKEDKDVSDANQKPAE